MATKVCKFLDLFSGERDVAKCLASRHSTWSLCFDLARSPNEDLWDPVLRQKLQCLIRLGCFVGGGVGPVCSIAFPWQSDDQSDLRLNRMGNSGSVLRCRRRSRLEIVLPSRFSSSWITR